MVHLIHLHSKLHMCIQPYHLVAIETHINNSWITFLQCFRLNYCKLYIPKNIFFGKRSVTNNSSTIRQLSLKLFFFRLYSKFKTNLKLNSIFSKEKHGVATHWKKRRKLREPRNAIETKRNWMSCFISILSREEIAALHRGSLNSRHFPRILDWKSRLQPSMVFTQTSASWNTRYMHETDMSFRKESATISNAEASKGNACCNVNSFRSLRSKIYNRKSVYFRNKIFSIFNSS